MFVFIFVLSHSLKNKIPKLPIDTMTQTFIYGTQICELARYFSWVCFLPLKGIKVTLDISSLLLYFI